MAKKKSKKPEPNSDDGKANEKSSGQMISKLLMLIVLGTASFGTVFMLPSNAAPELHEEMTTKADVHIDEPLALTKETGFLPLSPLTISLQDNARILKIGITLETTKGEEDYIDPNNPKVRDAFMGYLRALRVEQIEDAAFMAQMRSQLLRRAKLILGADVVQGILITDFLVR